MPSKKQNQDTGHWVFFDNFDPDDWFGFVYRIIEKDTAREYIGKKQFHQHLTKRIKGRKNKKHIKKPAKWKEYTSSSTHVNDAIEEKGKDNYIFVIESLHKTKSSLHYAETTAQILEDVLRAKMDDGTPKYYNKQIAGTKFIPPDEVPEETRMKISITLKERYEITPHWKATLSEEEMCALNEKFYSGKNNYLHRIFSDAERIEFLNNKMVGENNHMHGIPSPNKGKTYEEMYGIETSERYKDIIRENSKKLFGENHGMYGKTHTDEQKKLWKTDERRIHCGKDNGMYGKPCYYNMTEGEKESWKKNLSEAGKARVVSEETKQKMSEAQKGLTQEIIVCPHCNKEGGKANMHRYHFDNCSTIKQTNTITDKIKMTKSDPEWIKKHTKTCPHCGKVSHGAGLGGFSRFHGDNCKSKV